MCAVAYGLYFEKDQGDPTGITSVVSHRHDWECAVWVKKGASKPSYPSASGTAGSVPTRSAALSMSPGRLTSSPVGMVVSRQKEWNPSQ
ncbi:NPP1 family protein [Streptomyces sp. B4I13]|uniref:NPP1 family protein n=1 Tax=Streptomyces sp. B4I13 TaxID=3042271 RepID=UPI00359316F2